MNEELRQRLKQITPAQAQHARDIVEKLKQISPESRAIILARLKSNIARMDAGRKFELLY
jgi:hypothetical protein